MKKNLVKVAVKTTMQILYDEVFLDFYEDAFKKLTDHLFSVAKKDIEGR